MVWAIWQAARTGVARTVGEYAAQTDDPTRADQAVSWSPADAETHFVRGNVLQQVGDYEQAAAEFQHAVQLRPRDYYLWLSLGLAQDQKGDQESALLALRQSASLAPSYAQAHWQLGNLLLRMNQPDEAFAELRRAATSNTAVLPNVIDLAWGVYGGDIKGVLAVVPPQTDSARVELALFFARHQQSSAAVDQFLAAAFAPSDKSEALLRELLKGRAFSDAYRVWARMHAFSGDAIGTIRNADFEEPVNVVESGFGWQITPDVPNVAMSVDTAEHQHGAKSLRIDFRGDSTPSQPLITQLVLLKPVANYRLRFSAKSRELISAGLPVIVIRDASDPAQPALAQTSPLRSDGNGWQVFSIDVKTGAKPEAILISVERQNCSTPCPAFGTLWLDSFLIETK